MEIITAIALILTDMGLKKPITALTEKGRTGKMATDYISRDSALRAVVDAVELYPHEYDAITKEINFIPAADVRPVVSGSWIEATDYNGDTYYICPACEDEFVLTDGTLADNHYFFCPNCGADLRKVVEIDQVKEEEQ